MEACVPWVGSLQTRAPCDVKAQPMCHLREKCRERKQAALPPLRWPSLPWCCWCLELQRIWRSGIPPMEDFWMITTMGPGETTTILCMTTLNKGMWPGMRNKCSLFISAYPVELITNTWCALSDNLKPCFVGLVVLFSSLSSGCYNLPFLVQKELLFKGEWRLICS